MTGRFAFPGSWRGRPAPRPCPAAGLRRALCGLVPLLVLLAALLPAERAWAQPSNITVTPGNGYLDIAWESTNSNVTGFAVCARKVGDSSVCGLAANTTWLDSPTARSFRFNGVQPDGTLWDGAGRLHREHPAQLEERPRQLRLAEPGAHGGRRFRRRTAAATKSVGGNITVTFSEAVYSDTSRTAFTATSAKNHLLQLRSGTSSGPTIDFSVTLGTGANANKVFTIDPTNNLAEGKVYVGVVNNYYDYGSVRGSADSATFTVDLSGPSPSISPADDAVTSAKAGDITVTYDEPIFSDASGTAFTDSKAKALVTLKRTSATGPNIAFTAYASDSKTITINPTGDLADGDVYVAVSNNVWDGVGNRGTAANATFEVETVAPTVTALEVDSTTLTLTFSEAMDPAGKSATSAFTLRVAGSAVTVASYTVSSNKATFTISPPVVKDQTVNLSYVKPGSGSVLRDTAGNALANFGTRSVTNATGLELAPPKPGNFTATAGDRKATLAASLTGHTGAAVTRWQYRARNGTGSVWGDWMNIREQRGEFHQRHRGDGPGRRHAVQLPGARGEPRRPEPGVGHRAGDAGRYRHADGAKHQPGERRAHQRGGRQYHGDVQRACILRQRSAPPSPSTQARRPAASRSNRAPAPVRVSLSPPPSPPPAPMPTGYSPSTRTPTCRSARCAWRSRTATSTPPATGARRRAQASRWTPPRPR